MTSSTTLYSATILEWDPMPMISGVPRINLSPLLCSSGVSPLPLSEKGAHDIKCYALLGALPQVSPTRALPEGLIENALENLVALSTWDAAFARLGASRCDLDAISVQSRHNRDAISVQSRRSLGSDVPREYQRELYKPKGSNKVKPQKR